MISSPLDRVKLTLKNIGSATKIWRNMLSFFSFFHLHWWPERAKCSPTQNLQKQGFGINPLCGHTVWTHTVFGHLDCGHAVCGHTVCGHQGWTRTVCGHVVGSKLQSNQKLWKMQIQSKVVKNANPIKSCEKCKSKHQFKADSSTRPSQFCHLLEQ